MLPIVLHEKEVGLEDDVADVLPECDNIYTSLSHLQLCDLFRFHCVVRDVRQLLRCNQQELADLFVLSEKMLILLEVLNPGRDRLIEADPEIERLDGDALVLRPRTVLHQCKEGGRLIRLRNQEKLIIGAEACDQITELASEHIFLVVSLIKRLLSLSDKVVPLSSTVHDNRLEELFVDLRDYTEGHAL